MEYVEELVRELAQERLNEARAWAQEGGFSKEAAEYKIEDFLDEAREFVLRCRRAAE